MTDHPPPPPGEAARDERVAYHEAAHSVVAARVGHRLGPVTIQPGRTFGGCSWSDPPKLREADLERAGLNPAPLLPPRVRRTLETKILVCLAGGIGEELRFAGPGRRPPPIAERVTERLDKRPVPPATRAEAARVAEAAARPESEWPFSGDEETAADMAELLNWDDLASARLAVDWLSAVCRTMLRNDHRAVERVAGALLEHRTLGAEALRRIINPGRESS